VAGRPELAPGAFKLEANRAGASVFVHPRHVRGTLAEGFALARTLPSPFARAVFMMFMVAEVHPFADGNGRAARIMMNAEMVMPGLSVTIPLSSLPPS
jgi:fido (protein-threonine AMPylation protein)